MVILPWVHRHTLCHTQTHNLLNIIITVILSSSIEATKDCKFGSSSIEGTKDCKFGCDKNIIITVILSSSIEGTKNCKFGCDKRCITRIFLLFWIEMGYMFLFLM